MPDEFLKNITKNSSSQKDSIIGLSNRNHRAQKSMVINAESSYRSLRELKEKIDGLVSKAEASIQETDSDMSQ